MSSHARAARGFTLMEVVIAIAITAFIGTVIGVSFNTTIQNKEIIEGQAEHYRMLRAAMSRMVREIGAAYVSDRYDSKRYRDQYDRPTNFVGSRDKLLFTTLSHQRLYADAKESDQMVVEYQVKTSTDSKARGRTDLMRRENVLLEERMDRGGTEDTLFEGAKKIEFQYWNSERKQWEDEWDTRRTERKSMLPTRVKITLYAVDENGKEVKYTTQSRIMLNTELPRYQ
ncbi:MAG: type II secretion system protein GspJ [Myxococcaceae bacterium]